ncbi:MAG: hypothetical protein IJ568_03725 [Bacilli bacterium]|nr:hypothetical protein [Bacilli bacterium]
MNMLDEYIKFEKNNISLFAKEVLADYYDEEIFAKLLNTYIENRYYNFYSDIDLNLEENIFDHLSKTLEKLVEGVDLDTKSKINEMYLLFNYILCFDEVNIINDKTLVRLLCDYRRELFSMNDTIFQSNISKFIDSTRKKREKFFDYFHTDDFYIKKYMTSKENVIDIELNHKIKFPKLYSEYAIDRVFSTGDINEDRLFVEYYLITNVIIRDIRACIYDNYYLIEFATSLFDNKEKYEKLLNVASDDCFKNQTVMKITYNDYVKHNGNVKDMIRDGFKFAILIRDDDVKEEDFLLLDIFEYIIVNKNSKYCNTSEKNDKIIIIE